MSQLSEKFYTGLYSEIISEYIDAAVPNKINPSQAVYITGALSFLGRTSEADAIYDAHSSGMTLSESLESRFYLVLAHRRLRRKRSSAEARIILLSMARELRKNRSADDACKFFFFCSLAFYRYTDARLVLALKWARKAYDHAFRAQFPFGRLVSYDLMGHCQINVGDVRAGLKNLMNSSAIGESLGRGATKQAAEVSLRLYRSTFGLDRAGVLLEELRGAIRACSFENSFTLSNLLLEQARLQILSGSGHLAEQSLRESGEWVYRLDLPFFDANLSFRYAHLACLQGDYKKSLEMLRSARQRVAEANDASMEIRILGLEARVLELQGKASESKSLVSEIRRLEAKSGLIIAKRINARLGWTQSNVEKRSEDVLGDLMDDITEDSNDTRERLLASGFLGLIPGMVNCGVFSQAILFGFVKDSVTILAKGQIRHDPDGWPELVKKLFVALAENRELTKEEITAQVWKQNYNPLRYDPLIYALVARARKMLEPNEAWLTVTEGKYLLNRDLIVRDVSIQTVVDPIANRVAFEIISKYPDLPVRQSRIMDLCEKSGAITNKAVCEAFQVSEVTAGRDLTDLVEKGLLRRVGKGRATSYAIA